MSQVQYNGITLPYPLTTRFQQEAVRDDLGNVDWCATKFDIQVQCVLNADYLEGISSEYEGLDAVNAAGVVQFIRRRLLEHRRELVFSCNGETLVPPAAEVSGTVDVRNGPTPQSCTITQLSSETFLLVYHITAHYWERYDSDQTRGDNLATNPVMYNRWTESVHLDNCMYSTRNRSGKLMIRSDNNLGKTPDDFRNTLATVGVPDGFLRKSAKYVISPDGLALQYDIVDQEVFKMPPYGAYEASGEYIETVPFGGTIRWGEVRLRLRGAKDTLLSPQNKLIEIAWAIAGTKLGINGATMLAMITTKVGMYDNTVEVYAKALCNGKKFRKAGMAVIDGFTANLCETPGSEDSDGKQPDYRTRGTAAVLLQAAAYWDPNVLGTKLGTGNAFNAADNVNPGQVNSQNDTGAVPGTAGRTPE